MAQISEKSREQFLDEAERHAEFWRRWQLEGEEEMAQEEAIERMAQKMTDWFETHAPHGVAAGAEFHVCRCGSLYDVEQMTAIQRAPVNTDEHLLTDFKL